MPYKDPIKKKKVEQISKWKSRGLIGDYEAIYNRFINTTNCDLCNILLKRGRGGSKKCMEHDHENGEFRNVVCHSCNQKKSDKKKSKSNKSGYKNIHYCNNRKCWVYQKNFEGNHIYIRRKNKIDILCIKFAGLLLYKY